MQFSDSNYLLKFKALIRFLIIKILLFKKIRIERISYIGKNLKLFVSTNGKIIVRGKIHLMDNVELQSQGQLAFGNGCSINSYSRIIAFEKITLGNKVIIAQFVSILDHDHSSEIKNGEMDISQFKTAPIDIGNNVWIGDKVTITKGVKIGNNVVIGANSVVTKDIPSNSIAAGIPAKVIKTII